MTTTLPGPRGVLRRAHTETGHRVIIAVGLIYVLATLVPIAFLVFRTVQPGQSGEAFSTALRHVFSAAYASQFKNSVILAACTAVLCTVIATLFAWFLQRIRLPLRGLYETLLVASFALPPVLAATAWTSLLAPRAGFVNYAWNHLLGHGDLLNIRSMTGTVFVLVLVYVPFAYLVLSGAFAALPADDEEAALVHGCGPWQTFFRITLPSLRTALSTCLILVFTFAIQTFSIPLLLAEPAGIHTIAASMYLGIATAQIPIQESNLLGVFLLVIGAIAFFMLWRMQSRLSRNARGGLRVSGRRASVLDLGKARWVVSVLVALYFLVAVILPLVTLVVVSFMKYVTPQFSRSIFTLRNYAGVFETDTARLAITNTLELSAVCATVGSLIALVIAYLVARSRTRVARFVDAGSSLPLAIPRLVLAFGFLWAVQEVTFAQQIPNLLLLMIAVTLTFAGVGVRTFVTTFERLGPDLDDAAVMAGVPVWRRLLQLTIPLSLSTLISVWRTLFILALLEVDVVILIYQGNGMTLSVLTFVQLDQGFSTGVFPLAVAQIVLAGVVVVITGAVGAAVGSWSAPGKTKRGKASNSKARGAAVAEAHERTDLVNVAN
jgi:iron(III) transport system permease protein